MQKRINTTEKEVRNMKTIYLDCSFGACARRLAGALSELTDQESFIRKISQAGLQGVSVTAEKAVRYGTAGTVLTSSAEKTDALSQKEIRDAISLLTVEDSVKKDIREVYELLFDAYGHVQDAQDDSVCLHESGTMKEMAYIVSVCLLMHMIAPERVLSSPVSAGSGYTETEQGIQPVPSPAAVYLLQGIPVCANPCEGNRCTPAGAALLRHFADDFNASPVLVSEKAGYGMGKDTGAYSCVRAYLAESSPASSVTELVCSIDDQTAEDIGFAVTELFNAGALDVYTMSIQMKKNRPGVLLTCMCRTADKDRMIALMFRHLTTIGIREYTCRRHALARSFREIDTSLGKIRIKHSEGFGTVREKMEFEDLAEIARRQNMSLQEVRDAAEKEENGKEEIG